MLSRPVSHVFAVAAVLLSCALVSAQETHPFSVHDMLAMDRISGPEVSPDGQWIVFVLRKTDLEANRGRTDLWLVGVDGEGLKRLTSHDASDFNPRWSADGKSIFFLSTRSGSSQVWRLPVGGGESIQVTDQPLNVGNLVLSPDGASMAFSMEVFPDCADVECTVKRIEEKEKSKATGRVYDQTFVRHWDTWKDGRRSHLFAVSIEGGEAVDVTAGMDADIPSKPFGGPEEITFTPDSRSLVFAARDVGKEEPWSVDFDLYVVPADGSSKPKCLTEANEAWDTHPVFSPDGKTLAYMAMSRPRFESDRFRIVLKSWPDGEPKTLTEAWDRSAGTIVWSAGGRTIYTTASNIGQRSLFAIDTSSGDVRTLIKEGTIRSPVLAGDMLVFGMDHLQSPVELYSAQTDGTGVSPITRINADKVAAARMGEPEQFSFKGWNDETVYTYIVKPIDFDATKKYPVAFLIHGGPQGSFGNSFHYRWNPQAYAGAGYAAVMVDFHGSVGYGQAFTDSITGDWGGKPLMDLVKGLEVTLERYPWMDGERVAGLGASFGGYMVNWIAGKWPNRFLCLVNHDGNLDERFAYYATDELWFPEWEHGGPAYENPQGYEKHNPVNFVQNWKTPMLVIQGALDFRIVDAQGIATFTALQRRGIPSKLLFFPDENHWVLSPANSIQWHDTVIGWIDQWTKE
jgi:dipeptidyl aminopeptidase/acylaminoacyl peptidase